MPNLPIKLECSLFNVKIDREGEARITFAFPLTEINKVAEISKLTERLLVMEVDEAEPSQASAESTD